MKNVRSSPDDAPTRMAFMAEPKVARPQFAEVADLLPIMLRRTRPDRCCDFVNRRWSAFTGRHPDQELDSGWTEAIHPDDFDRAVALLDAALETTRPVTLEYRLRQRGGGYRWLRERGEAIYHRSGAFAGFVHACVDVDEPAAAGSSHRDALDQTRRLLRGLTHRARNHFQMAVTLLEIQSRQTASEEARRELEEAANRIHLIALLQHHLDPTRLDPKLCFGAYVHDLCKGLSAASERRGIRFTVHSDDTELRPEAALPASLLIDELLTNALKHAFPVGGPGHVKVVIAGDDSNVTVLIADDGVGLPEGIDPSGATSGGMALVGKLATLIRATISIERDGGTGFVLRIPKR